MAIVRAGDASVEAVGGWVIHDGVVMTPAQASELSEAFKAAAMLAKSLRSA